MNKFYRSLLVTGIVAAGLAGCGDDVTITEPPPPPPPPAPTVSVTVGPDGVSVGPGQTVQMSAAVTQSAGCNAAVTWSVSDATRASVSATGLVTIAANATTGAVAVRATATCATGGATANGVATLNVVGTTVTGVTVTPSIATVNAGTSNSPAQTLQASASVQGTNNPSQAVTWSSLDATIATVDASGLVTANSNGLGGPVNIRACSNADNTKCGFLALTVIVPSPATVQIQAVTFNNGTNNVPVNLQNVFGQIEIALNVEPGARNITRVDALIGGQVVASQAFSSAAPARAADTPETAPTVVILSTNTTQLRENGGIFVPVIFNGNSAITANLYVSGSSTPIASNAIPVVMNNGDAVVRRRIGTRTATLKETSSTPSAVSTNDGNTYFKGTQDVTGYDYLAFGRAVPEAVNLDSDLCGESENLIQGTPSATAGIALSGIYDCGGITGTDVEGGNSVEEDVETDYADDATGPDGTPLTAPEDGSCGYSSSVVAARAPRAAIASSNGVATVGSAFQVNGENRWNMFCPPVGPAPGPQYIDNKAPDVGIAGDLSGFVPGQVAFDDAFDQPWINAIYTFTIYNSLTNPGGDVYAADGGVGLDATSPTVHQFISTTCNSTPAITTGADLPETITSSGLQDGLQVCVRAADQLGNASESGGSNFFGDDQLEPLSRLAGTVVSPAATPSIAPSTVASVSAVANTSIYGDPVGLLSPFPAFPATDVWGLEGLDGRSGFNQNGLTIYPAVQSLTRLAVTGATACVVTQVPPPFFTSVMNVNLSDQYVRTPVLVGIDCLLGIGYYDYDGYVVDRAGNSSTTISRNFARDDVAAPNIGAVSPATVPMTPGGSAAFAFTANDDLEVVDGTLSLTQLIATAPGTLSYPIGTLQSFGAKWDATLTSIITAAPITIPYFLFRIDQSCGPGFTPGSCPAPGITTPAPIATVAADYSTGAASLPTAVTGQASDVADQLSLVSPSFVILPQYFSPNTGIAPPWPAASTSVIIPGTQDLVSWSAAVVGSTAVAQHTAITSVPVPYFESVGLFRVTLTGTTVSCGAFPAPVRTDNGNFRFWTYTATLPSTGPCTGAGFAAGGNWRAMGVKTGAGLVTPLF